MDYSARAPFLTQRRASAIHRFDASCRDLRTQIAPDVKSKYDSLSLSPALSFFLPFPAPPPVFLFSPADSIGATNFLPRFPSAHPPSRAPSRAPARKRLVPPFNLRGIILRMPRLVALLDEEENKLYSQVFSRGGGDEKRRRIG